MSDEQLLSAKQLEALKTQPYLEMLTLEVKLIKGLNILLKMGEKFQ